MNLLFLSRRLASVCLVLTLGLAGPVMAEVKVATQAAVDPAEVVVDPSKTGALLLSREVEGDDEPLYAGTSMWFLLSIALLGSIAVQRRTDETE